jgi:phosphoribosyl-AMP cyclohydrolase
VTIEDTTHFAPRFGADGLLPAVAVDARSGEVLMLAWMNPEALERTLATTEAHFWSRSRKRLWRKGETSGETLRVVEILTDCDQDALLLKVAPQGQGAACHTGRRSCFYRVLKPGQALEFRNAERLFEPTTVYGNTGAGD